MFLKSTSRDIDDELAKIDPSKYYLNFGTILPDEEVIDEMNDFEKRAMIWMSLEVEKIKEDIRQLSALPLNIDPETVKRLAEEDEEQRAMIKFLQYRVSKSIVERIGLEKLFVIKGNFQIVLTNKKNKETEAKRLEEIFCIEVSDILDKKTSRNNQ